MDRTLILVKPDAFARGLSGEIIARFERKGLQLVALRSMTVERGLAEQHYAEHAERPFFGELVEFITSGPIVAMVLQGVDAVKAARQVIGATNPLEAGTGSIRGDFAIEMGRNMVHGSDSPESAAREAALFFPDLQAPVTPPALVLASGSPQRRELLARTGVPFTVRVSDASELQQGEDPAGVAVENALRKARAAVRPGVAEAVLGCDTIVVLDGVIYGKPPDARAARATLAALGGRTHEVISGVALLLAGGGDGGEPVERTAVARTRVTFRALDERLLDWYVGTEEWRGRSGGYAIQGAGERLALSVDGEVENVVGLPLRMLPELSPELFGR